MTARVHLASIVLCAAAASLPAGQARSPLARLFDTGSRSKEPLSADALTRKAGWKLIPEGNVTHRFSGEAVLWNGSLAVVVRPKGGDIEVYSIAAGARLRASVTCAAGRSSTAAGLTKLDIVENAPSAVTVAATFGAPASAAIKLRLTTGVSILEIQAPRRASTLNVVTRARYVVVPDFFADDMVFGPDAPASVPLPAENFFLNLVDGGSAIVMCVWQPRRLGASATIVKSTKGAYRCSSRIDCAGGKSVWLAFLEGSGIWHEGPRHSGLKRDKSGWKPPFPAKWRCSQVKRTGFASSWDLAPAPTTKPSSGKIDGPVVVYPIDRVLATPLTVYCPTDVLRNTLGVGPCEHILTTEGLATPSNPTPDNVMTWVQRQFKRKRGRASAEEVRKRLREMTEHVGRARARIGQYGDLAGAVLAICREKSPLPPAAAGLSTTAERIRKTVEEGLQAAGPSQRVAALAGEVLALIPKEGAAGECERLAAQLRAIGAAQSRTLSKCRMAACWLRQQCVMAARRDRKISALTEKIQDRVERVLQ